MAKPHPQPIGQSPGVPATTQLRLHVVLGRQILPAAQVQLTAFWQLFWKRPQRLAQVATFDFGLQECLLRL
jgi:hypothetical protein